MFSVFVERKAVQLGTRTRRVERARIAQHGLIWTRGLALAADVVRLALPAAAWRCARSWTPTIWPTPPTWAR